MLASKLPLITKKNLLPASKNWMVVYTRSNWEKKAGQLLTDNGLVSYCPVIKVKKKWADRYKTVEIPLFKSYLFVQITPLEQTRVLQVPGIVSFVKHCGLPVRIQQDEMERVKNIITVNDTNLEVINYKQFGVGDRIYINHGPFINQEGHIANINGSSILMVLEQLGCALVVKVSQNHITHISTCLS